MKKHDSKEIENARAKMERELEIVDKIRETLEQAEKRAFEAEFEYKTLVRKGNIEEIFWRFPHIGKQVLNEVDTDSILKCKEVNKWWQRFVDEPDIFALRKLERLTNVKKELLMKKKTVIFLD